MHKGQTGKEEMLGFRLEAVSAIFMSPKGYTPTLTGDATGCQETLESL
jgi:hypothetical protein